MFDHFIIATLRGEREPDRIPYTCSKCRHVTYAPPRLTAITCGHCGKIDLGTYIARARWQAAVAPKLTDADPTPRPCLHPADVVVMAIGLLALVLS
jgi:hypothetical protein